MTLCINLIAICLAICAIETDTRTQVLERSILKTGVMCVVKVSLVLASCCRERCLIYLLSECVVCIEVCSICNEWPWHNIMGMVCAGKMLIYKKYTHM